MRDYRIGACRIFGEKAICSVRRSEPCAKRGLRVPEDIRLLERREAVTKGVGALVLRARLARWKENLLASGRNQRCNERDRTPRLVVHRKGPTSILPCLWHGPMIRVHDRDPSPLQLSRDRLPGPGFMVVSNARRSSVSVKSTATTATDGGSRRGRGAKFRTPRTPA